MVVYYFILCNVEYYIMLWGIGVDFWGGMWYNGYNFI